MTTPAGADDVHRAPPHPCGPGRDRSARGPGRGRGRRRDRAARRRHRVDRHQDPARRRSQAGRCRDADAGQIADLVAEATQSRRRRPHPTRLRSGRGCRGRQPGLRRLRDHDRRDPAARRRSGRAGVDQRDAVLRRPLRCARFTVRDDGLGVAHLPRSPHRGPGGPPGRVARPRPRRAGHAVLAARDPPRRPRGGGDGPWRTRTPWAPSRRPRSPWRRARRRHVDDDLLRSADVWADEALGDALPVPRTGALLAAAVADERAGVTRDDSAVVDWLTDPGAGAARPSPPRCVGAPAHPRRGALTDPLHRREAVGDRGLTLTQGQGCSLGA